MQLQMLMLITIVCYWLYYYFKKKLNYFKDQQIPYLPGLPLVGNMGPAVIRRKHISEILQDIYNVDPDAKYVGFFDFNRTVIMLRDLELIKNVTIKNFDNFPDHLLFIDDSVDPLFGGNLFSMSGERWKEARNLLTPAFTSSKMKGMFDLMVECAENFINYMTERSQTENNMIKTKDLFTKYTNDVIATCAFGIKVDSLKDPNNKFYVLGKEATNFEGILSVKFFLARAFSRIFKLAKIKFVEDHVADFFKKIVSDTVKMRDEKGIRRPDMIQLMMDARGGDNKHLKLDIVEMTAQAFIFFFGGFDSTSTQMCIIAHELAINPDIQSRFQEEIDEVLRKTNGKPNYEAINAMPYLDAIFNESMRRHTQASFIDRLCVKAYELPPALPGGKPFTVQPGMNVWVAASAIHRDPKHYDNPDTFDPNRYYTKKVTVNDMLNLGFGAGPRSCIGNRFAILETKILLFFMLAKFNLKPNTKTCNPLRYNTRTFSISPKGGWWLTVEPRK